MTRIYANRPFVRRMNASAAIVVAAFLFGAWELWAAANAGPEGAGYNYLFAALFLGGGAYAMRQLLSEYSDTVVAMDVEGADAVISVWRPFAAKRIAGGLDRLSGWRFEVRTERSVSTPMLLADHPEHPRPLRLELGKGIAITDALRALAPQAVARFEEGSRAAGAR